MKTERQLLRGVKGEHYRGALGTLIEQGWGIQSTANGHLKLTHKDAPAPIFTSSTPSDHRTSKNVLLKARRLLSGVSFDTSVSDATVSIANLPTPKGCRLPLEIKQKEKRRWSAAEKARKLVDEAARIIASETQTPDCENPEDGNTVSLSAGAQIDMQEIEKNNMTIEQAAPIVDFGPEIMAEIAVGSAVVGAANMNVISIEELDLAMKIVTGGYHNTLVTKDMVGGFILVDGEAFLSGIRPIDLAPALDLERSDDGESRTQVRSTSPSPVFRKDRTSTTPDAQVDKSFRKDPVFRALKSFGKPTVCRDVAIAIHGREVSRSEKETVRRALRRMTVIGAVSELQTADNNGQYLYAVAKA